MFNNPIEKNFFFEVQLQMILTTCMSGWSTRLQIAKLCVPEEIANKSPDSLVILVVRDEDDC